MLPINSTHSTQTGKIKRLNLPRLLYTLQVINSNFSHVKCHFRGAKEGLDEAKEGLGANTLLPLETSKNFPSPLFILSFQKNPSRFHIVLIRSITLIYGESKEFTDRKHLSQQITVIQQIAMKLHRKKL